MAASMSGTAAVKGQEFDVNASASDIFKNPQFGAMGVVFARKGDWGVGGDAIWMALGKNVVSPGPLGIPAGVDVNQGAFAFYGLRRLKTIADLTFGARINTIQNTTRIGAASQVSYSASKTWVDPLVGLQIRTPEKGSRWHAQVYAETGGFGVGSKVEVQVFPTVGLDLGKRVALDFGYRWLYINYQSGADVDLFKYDVWTQGPVLGFVFKF
jgi:hypothetical protein